LGLMQEVQAHFSGSVLIESPGGHHRNWLRLKRGPRIAVRTCLCFKTASGRLRWTVRSDRHQNRSFALLALMNVENNACLELYLLPPVSLPPAMNISIESRLLRMGKRLPGTDAFLKVFSWMRRKQQICRRQR
jgi:hypothetical protein